MTKSIKLAQTEELGGSVLLTLLTLLDIGFDILKHCCQLVSNPNNIHSESFSYYMLLVYSLMDFYKGIIGVFFFKTF